MHPRHSESFPGQPCPSGGEEYEGEDKEEKKSSALRRPALQRLAAFGGVDTAVLVEIAAREVAVGLGHEFGERHDAVLVGVEQLEIGRLLLRLAVGRQHAV